MPQKPNRPARRLILTIGIVVTLFTITGHPPSSAAPPGDPSVKPFKINIDDSVLEDLRARLDRTRFPDQLKGVGWDYGTDLAYLIRRPLPPLPEPLRTRRILADQVRLARARAQAERVSPIHDRHRRGGYPFYSRALETR